VALESQHHEIDQQIDQQVDQEIEPHQITRSITSSQPHEIKRFCGGFMNWRRYVRDRLGRLDVAPEREIEIVDELAMQLEATYSRERGRGAGHADAMARASAEIPDWGTLAATLRGIERRPDPTPAPGLNAAGWISGLAQDVRHSWRSLTRAPGFLIASTLTLALGIAATTAIGSAAIGVLWRPLPFPEPERLVLVTGSPMPGWAHTPLSFADAHDLAELTSAFESFGAWASAPEMRVPFATGDSRPEEVQFALANAGFLPALGLAPALGRWFVPKEDELGAEPVAIISDGLWRRAFGSSLSPAFARTDTPRAPARSAEAAFGREGGNLSNLKLDLDGRTYDVVGVLPPGFAFGSAPREIDVWLPFGRDPVIGRRFSRGTRFLGAVGRLTPGVTRQRAEEHVELLAKRLAAELPDQYRDRHFEVLSLEDEVRRDLRAPLVLLLAAAAFMLTIACVNVGNLMVVRASARAREFAVRVSLGAGRGRLIRQLIVETALVVAAGSIGGTVLAVLATGLISRLLERTPNPFIPLAFGASAFAVDLRVLVLAALVASGICVVVARASMSRLSIANPADVLRAGHTVGGSRRWRRSLIAVEVALSVMLLAGAVLFARSLARLDTVDPGFRAEHVLTAEINLRPTSYGNPRAAASFYDRVLAEIGSAPGVMSASLTEFAPFAGADSSNGVFIEGRDLGDPVTRPRVHQRAIGPAYFEAMGIPLKAGRIFDAHDTAEGERVTIVNETLARQLWPGESALGKRFSLDYEAMRFYRDRPPTIDLPAGWRTIVGIVGDVRHAGPTSEPVPEAYQPAAQRPPRTATFVVRGALNPIALESGLREAVARVDPRQPLGRVRPLEDLVAASTARPRSSATLLEVLAGLAIALAAIGIYGVVAFSMRLRIPEIGVRLALGASRWSIVRLVSAEGLVPCVIGIAAGATATIGLSRYVESLLYQVSSKDPFTYASSASVILVVAVTACAAPVRRALALDPVSALRSE
jgi:predicted permease